MTDRTILVRLRADVAGFKQGMKEAAAASKDAAVLFDANGKRIENTGQRIVKSAEVNSVEWTRAGTAITAFGVAGAAAFGLSAKAAIDWESSWAGVLKTVDGSGEQLMALEDSLRGMSLEVSASQSEIAGVAEAAGQLGVGVDNIAAFTRVMIDLGETTNLTANDAATALARISNIMGTSASDVDRMGAVIVDIGNNSATTEAEIVELATRLAAAGKQAGLSESDIFAFGAALTSVGVEAEAGGTAMSKVFTSIADATRDGGEKLQTFADIAGVSTSAFKQAFEDDGATAISMFVSGMGDLANSGESTTKVFDDLELTDERLKRAILSLGSAGTLLNDELEIGNKAWIDNSALVEEAEKRYDTTEAKIQIAKNAINEFAITTGEDLLPVLAQMAEGVAGAAEAFANMPEPLRLTLTGLGGVATVTALAAGGFLVLAPRVFETIAGFKTLRNDMPGVASGMGKVGKAAGALSIALAAVAVGAVFKDFADEWRDTKPDLADMRNELATTATSAQLMAGQIGAAGANMDAIRKISNELDGEPWYQFGASVQVWIDKTVMGKNAAQQATDAMIVMDDALAGFAGIDLSSAQGQFNLIAEGFGAKTDDDLNAILDTMPKFRTALTEAATDAGITANTVNVLGLATGDLDISTGQATQSISAFASAQEEEAAATEAAAKAMQELIEAVAGGVSAFYDGSGAYQGVIDANVATAQAQADRINAANDAANDARRKNDKDTVDYVTSEWEDFYDGQTVSIDDYIAKLQEQADAQANFEANLTALNDRVKTDILPDQQGLAYEFINQLAASGPEGAAQADLLKNSSAEQLQSVVDLWARGGDDAATEFAANLIAGQQPEVKLQLDTSDADVQYELWARGLQARFGFSSTPDLGKTSTGRPVNVGAFATGGIASTPQLNIWAEGMGREAYVPLDLPLSQVDPSVRGLAAYAQGNMNTYATGGVAGGYGEASPPQVITVPVESRYETHAPVNVYTSASSIDGISAEARRRTNSWAGSRG